MRAPLSWIREFTPLDGVAVDVADALNQLGLEVEGHRRARPRRERRRRRPHPRRRRRIPTPTGSGSPTSISATVSCASCAARRTSKPGMVVPFARVGAVLPGDFKIERRKIRGVVSEGMLCSARELGLGDDHDGILELPADAPLGTDVREVLGLDDVVFDLSITPNRPDAMGIVGVARELAAHFGSPFSVDEHEPAPLLDEVAGAHVVVEAPDRCPRFVALAARVVDGRVARLDAAAADARGHAPDQQRRRRHELRDARTLPSAPRVRPRPARRPRHRRAARGRRREDDHARRRRTHLHERRPPDLRRRAQRRRASPGSWAAPRPRCPTRPPRSCSSRRTSSRAASRARRSGSVCAPRRARGSSGASIRTTREPARPGRWNCSPRSRARFPRPVRSTCIRSRSSGPHHRAHRARQPAARHLAVDGRDRRLPHAPRHRDARATDESRRCRRSVPTSSARSTSSRRSPAASASTGSRARCRRAPRRSAG